MTTTNTNDDKNVTPASSTGGTITSTTIAVTHVYTRDLLAQAAHAPTAAIASGGGTSPSVAVNANSCDSFGSCLITTGSTCGTTVEVTVTFNSGGMGARNPPTIVVTPYDSGGTWSDSVTWHITAATTTSFTVKFKNAAVNLTDGATYGFSWFAGGRVTVAA